MPPSATETRVPPARKQDNTPALRNSSEATAAPRHEGYPKRAPSSGVAEEKTIHLKNTKDDVDAGDAGDDVNDGDGDGDGNDGTSYGEFDDDDVRSLAMPTSRERGTTARDDGMRAGAGAPYGAQDDEYDETTTTTSSARSADGAGAGAGAGAGESDGENGFSEYAGEEEDEDDDEDDEGEYSADDGGKHGGDDVQQQSDAEESVRDASASASASASQRGGEDDADDGGAENEEDEEEDEEETRWLEGLAPQNREMFEVLSRLFVSYDGTNVADALYDVSWKLTRLEETVDKQFGRYIDLIKQ